MANVFGTTFDNLTAITWSHATNSQEKLRDVLNSDIQMIEADIVWGYLNDETTPQPVMGHPPAEKSDISLEQFIQKVLDFNTKQTSEKSRKGIKLDFKSTEVFNKSILILTNSWTTNFPIWLNADIIEGPVDPTSIPVDPKSFFAGCKKFDGPVLSIGWTTRWGKNFTEGQYTEKQIDDMIGAIKDNNLTNFHITFPVRAGILAHSQTQMLRLQKAVQDTKNQVTFTIWSSDSDNVDIEKLRKFIFEIGLDKVYVDVPEEVSSHLRLDLNPNSSYKFTASWLLLTLLMIGSQLFSRL